MKLIDATWPRSSQLDTGKIVPDTVVPQGQSDLLGQQFEKRGGFLAEIVAQVELLEVGS